MSRSRSFDNDDDRKLPARERNEGSEMSSDDQSEHAAEGAQQTSVFASPASKNEAAIVKRPVKAKTGKKRGEGSRKPKDMPRRPLSAYNYFFRECREQLMTEPTTGQTDFQGQQNSNNPELFGELGKVIAKRWREISEQDLEKYKDMAAADMDRYCREMNEYRLKRAKLRRLRNAETNDDTRATERPSLDEVSGSLSDRSGELKNQALSDAPRAPEASSLLQPLVPVQQAIPLPSLSAGQSLGGRGSLLSNHSTQLQHLQTSQFNAALAGSSSNQTTIADLSGGGRELSLLRHFQGSLQSAAIPSRSASLLPVGSSLLPTSTPFHFGQTSSGSLASNPNLGVGLPQSSSLPATTTYEELFRLGMAEVQNPSIRNSLMRARMETDAVARTLQSRQFEIERMLALSQHHHQQQQQQQQQQQEMLALSALHQRLHSQSLEHARSNAALSAPASSNATAAIALAAIQNNFLHAAATSSSSGQGGSGSNHSEQTSNQHEIDDYIQFLLRRLQGERERDDRV